ncbi:YciI family protein [Spirillospora sp. NPDC048911]|uniref:YciI family protein n=1 Tax=Spirillospora sp. NPDC048911 TaxID=3364527 RepID=UPI003723DECA
MKYMIIIYGNQELWESFSPEEWKRTVAEQDAFNLKYKESGELLGAYGTGDVQQARTVRVRDGVAAVTDGPYLETKEHLASWCMIEVPDERRALEIAAEIPHASLRAVEVWPIMHEASWNRP